MHRRNLLKLGAVSTVVLTMGGAWLAHTLPGWANGRFSESAQAVWHAVARAVLEGVLPTEAPDQAQALAGLLARLSTAVAALPPHAQTELSHLLGLLGTPPGRRWLGGLAVDWRDASVPEVQVALQDMRNSRISLRQQAYLALHDLIGAAYFSDPSTWAVLDYPGPLKL
jgi:hypothetical protein